MECGPPRFRLSTSERSLTDHFSLPASPHLPKRPCRASLPYCGKAPRQRGVLHLKDESRTRRKTPESVRARPRLRSAGRFTFSSSEVPVIFINARARVMIKCVYSGRLWLSALFVCLHFTLQIIEGWLWAAYTCGAVGEGDPGCCIVRNLHA